MSKNFILLFITFDSNRISFKVDLMPRRDFGDISKTLSGDLAHRL